MHLLLTPLLLLFIVLMYAGVLMGLAVLGHVAGAVGLAFGLFFAFLACCLPGECRPFGDQRGDDSGE
jgi:hypothetical protein